MPAMGSDDYLASSNTLSGRLAVWLATGLGIGLIAPAPGTVGGLWGLALAAPIAQLSPLGLQLAIIAVLLVVGVAVCTAATRALGTTGDPGAIVLDEVIALPIVYLGFGLVNWALLIAGFLMFRLFDIWKPGLARSAERLPDGWGVMADDAVAAVQGCFALHAAAWLDRAAGFNWLGTGV
jgi:phosphatidylglycerophosphatase A